MRLRDLGSEALRSVSTGAARPFIMLLLAVLPVLGMAGSEALTVQRLDERAGAFRSAGAAVLVLEAPGRVYGPACDALAYMEGVTGAGALRATTRGVRPSTTPFTTVPVFEATTGLGRLLGVDLDSGVALERSLAVAYHVRAGQRLSTTDGTLVVGGSFPFARDGRSPRLESSIMGRADSSSAYDQCWMETWPFDPDQKTLMFSALTLGPTPDQFSVVQLNPTLGSRLTVAHDYTQRTSRWLTWVASVWAAIVVLGGFAARRLEWAFFRHLGGRGVDAALLMAAELTLWFLPGLVAGAVLLRSATALDLMSSSAAWHGVAVLGFAGVGGYLGSVAAATLLRERNLYRYFQRRT